jgi:hypothetical protein
MSGGMLIKFVDEGGGYWPTETVPVALGISFGLGRKGPSPWTVLVSWELLYQSIPVSGSCQLRPFID